MCTVRIQARRAQSGRGGGADRQAVRGRFARTDSEQSGGGRESGRRVGARAARAHPQICIYSNLHKFVGFYAYTL